MRSPARWIVVALAFLGAVAFSLSVTAGQWWMVGEAAIGPFGTHSCMSGECRASGLGWAGGSATWERAAIATGGAGLIATLVLLVIAGAAAAGRAPRIAAKSALAAVFACVTSASVFVMGLPTLGETSIARGLVLFVIGIVFALAAATIVLRTPRPTA